jgi:hypothetical protein
VQQQFRQQQQYRPMAQQQFRQQQFSRPQFQQSRPQAQPQQRFNGSGGARERNARRA